MDEIAALSELEMRLQALPDLPEVPKWAPEQKLHKLDANLSELESRRKELAAKDMISDFDRVYFESSKRQLIRDIEQLRQGLSDNTPGRT